MSKTNMYFIAHRGNIDSINQERENSPDYIREALDKGYDVKIDVWFINGEWFLGHDEPLYKIKLDFLRNKKIWCHAKNINALNEMLRYNCYYEEIIGEYAKPGIHCFWHQEDNYTITSRGIIWAYPNKPLTKKTICVLPEKSPDIDLNHIEFSGFCSDYIEQYRNIYSIL